MTQSSPIFLPGKTCLIIAGPTAVGKTAYAVQLAKYFNTQIISADSRQCYKELNIGVAKPDAAELNAIPHYFINSHSIHDEVNAAVFESYALQQLQKIFLKNDVAVMVGGTGLYIKAFCEGIDPIPAVDVNIRNNIFAGYETGGITWLQQQVEDKDPVYFSQGEMHNPQRLMRALEVKLSTGKSIVTYQTKEKKQREFNIVKIGLELPREALYNRINQRADVMMKEGLEGEVKRLIPLRNLNALQTVGYRELFDYFEGLITVERAVELIKQNTRHYAKRQLTWFKKDAAWKWINPQYPLEALLAYISLGKAPC
jgi:tRNA dimethylallyltransferase